MKDALLVTKDYVYKIVTDIEHRDWAMDEHAGIEEKHHLPNLYVEGKLSNESFFSQAMIEVVQPDNCRIFLSNTQINRMLYKYITSIRCESHRNYKNTIWKIKIKRNCFWCFI